MKVWSDRGSTCKFRNARNHEKQTSRIQSLYLYFNYFIKIVPFWLRNIRFLIQNTRSLFYGCHYSPLHRLMSLHRKLNVKIVLMFIVAENTGSVNIRYYSSQPQTSMTQPQRHEETLYRQKSDYSVYISVSVRSDRAWNNHFSDQRTQMSPVVVLIGNCEYQKSVTTRWTDEQTHHEDRQTPDKLFPHFNLLNVGLIPMLSNANILSQNFSAHFV